MHLKERAKSLKKTVPADKLTNRCPDCGTVEHNDKKAVRPASNNEIDELLRIRAEDKENQNDRA